MRIGDKLDGTVIGIKAYGAFIDLDNGQTGLIHISEIKTGFVDDIFDILSIGQRVHVQVIDVDEYTHKASLSLRTLEEEKYHFHHKHRFSNSRLHIGFTPLKKALPVWIDEGLDYIDQQM